MPAIMANLFLLLLLHLLLLQSSLFVVFLPYVVVVVQADIGRVASSGTADGSEQWGYVEVRPKAHLFWWLYKSPNRVEDPSNPWPILLWLQGGPGASGVGLGSFLEFGPLDGNLKPRNSTWLLKADLLFVDSPVGTGFSYMEDTNLTVRSDEESATDLTTFLKELFNSNESLQKSPLYIFAESYGGKFAATLGVSALKAIDKGDLKAQLQGVALGNTWISPEDFVFSWAPLLKDVSRIDENGLIESNRLAKEIQQQLAVGEYENATDTWVDLENIVSAHSNYVDYYNFLLDSGNDPTYQIKRAGIKGYSTYLTNKFYSTNSVLYFNLSSTMNGPVKEKLKIIPSGVTWNGQDKYVFPAMTRDFMKPRISEVDELLAKGINVTIYNGQLDLICSTKGVESWINKLKWDGLGNFLSTSREPLYCGGDKSTTKGFTRSYKNLHFYWILGAGHFVPTDQPCVALQMVGSITRSPNTSS